MHVHMYTVFLFFFMPHVFCLFCLLFLCYFVLLISLFFFLVLPYLVPVIGCTNTAGNAWKLEQDRTCFSLPGRLPYSQVRDREWAYECLGMSIWEYGCLRISVCMGMFVIGFIEDSIWIIESCDSSSSEQRFSSHYVQ